MKLNKIIITLLIISCLTSCQSDKDNVILTDFTMELISAYINDEDNFRAKERKDEIILISTVDTYEYYLSVFANDRKSYKYCSENFVGQTMYLGRLIRVFGDENSFFYSLREQKKTKTYCKDESIFYDPSVWLVCINKDLSFNEMRSFKVSPSEDMGIIKSLAEKYFNISNDSNDTDIFHSTDVEIAPHFALGEDSLRQLISSNFNVKRDNIQDKLPVVIDIIISKDGKVTLKGIKKSSNDTDIDKEALRIAEIICQYEFIPASHRGKNVNAIYSLMFLRRDVIP